MEGDGQENLLKNTDFENGLAECSFNQFHNPSWYPTSNLNTSPHAGIVVSDTGRIGFYFEGFSYVTKSTESFLRIRALKSNYHSVFQSTTSIIGGDTYRFEARLRANFKFKGRGGRYFVQVRWYDNSGEEVIDTRTTFNIQKGRMNSFVREYVDLVAPDDAVSATVYLNAHDADGTADFDDIGVRHLY